MISAGEFPKVGVCDSEKCVSIQNELYSACEIAAYKYRTYPEKAEARYDAFVKVLGPMKTEDGAPVELKGGKSSEASLSQRVFADTCYNFFMDGKQLPNKEDPIYAPLYEDGDLSLADVMTMNREVREGSPVASSYLYQSPEENPAEKVWSCVEDKFLKGGGSKEELRRLANIGYWIEPQGHRRFADDPSRLEVQEKLNLAYRDPEYYQCIVDNGLPVHFAMNDFNVETTFDDTTRARFNEEVDAIKAELLTEAEKYPEGSPAWRFELTRRIFEQTLENDKLYSDCEIECPDHEAMKYRRGACTESTAIIYYKYKYAGLNPDIFHLHGMTPSLEWIELLPELGNAADHIYIGVPLSVTSSDGTGPEDTASTQYVYADLAQRKFDVKYGHGIRISERIFTSFVLNNRKSDLLRQQRLEEAEETLEMELTVAPADINTHLSLLGLYDTLGRKDDVASLTRFIRRRFKEHPLIPLMDVETSEELEDALKEMGDMDPYVASRKYYDLAHSGLGNFLQKARAASEKGGQIDPGFREQLNNEVGGIVLLYGRSLLLNPKNIFAYRDLEQLFEEVGNHEDAIAIYKGLVDKYPDHLPFVYSLAEHLFNASQATGINVEKKQQFLSQMIQTSEHFAGLAPASPLPHTQMSRALINLGAHQKALDAVLASNELYATDGKPIPLDNYKIGTACNIVLANVDDALAMVKEAVAVHPEEAPRHLASRLYNFLTWNFGMKQDGFIADGVVPFNKAGINTDYFEAVDRICLFLDEYDDAREYLDLIRAYFAPFVMFFIGEDRTEDWVDEISSKPSDRVLNRLAESTKDMTTFIKALNAHMEPETYEEINSFLEEVEPLLEDDFSEVVDEVRVGLLWGYILIGDRDEAEDVLDDLPRERVIGALGFSIGKLKGLGRRTRKSAERLGLAMDLLWDNRKLLSEGQRAHFVEFNYRLATLCREHDMIEEAEAAEKRGADLRK